MATSPLYSLECARLAPLGTVGPTNATDRLRAEFLEDHRTFVRGLTDLRAALAAGEDERAVRLAAELDAAVGPHIAFEERWFYPELVPVLGAAFVRRLYGEHDQGRRVVEALAGGDGPLDAARRAQLVADLDATLEHASSCGGLLGHLERLDEERCEDLCARLAEARRAGSRWTELARRPPAPVAPR